MLLLLPFQTHPTIPEYLLLDGLEEGGKVSSFEHYFLPVLVVSLSEELFVEIEFYVGRFQELQFVFEFVDNVLDPFLTLVPYPDMDEFLVGRVGEFLAFGETVHEKIPIISLGDIAD